jgi:cytosine/adenosine deaminase-related metal-dependent hydrolase
MDDILSVADGIALPSVTDMERSYVEKCADAAHKAGKPFAIHASERIREDMEFILSLEPAFVVHMVAATDRDLRMTADAGVPVVVCPRSNAYFGIAAPVVRMLDAGITVALGTDNAMLCTPDLRPEALMVSRMLSDAGRDPSEAMDILRDGSAAIAERLGIAAGGPGIRLPLPEGSDGALSALSSDGPAEWL